MLKTVIIIINGIITDNVRFIIPPDKIATIGLYTATDTFPPTESIKVVIMGNIISHKIAIFLITISMFLYKPIIWVDNNKITHKLQEKNIVSDTLSFRLDKRKFCDTDDKTPIAITQIKIGNNLNTSDKKILRI